MKKIGLIVGIVLAIGLLFGLSNSLVVTNKAGFYQVKQAAVTGTMSVRSTPGMYAQLFGEITEYQISDMYYFSKYAEEGGEGLDAAAIEVRFNDGGKAYISGSIKYKLSLVSDNQLALHEDFKSYDAVKEDLIRQVVTESLMQTATLMKAEESYSTRRSEFTSLAETQVKQGIFKTESEEIKTTDADDNEFIERFVNVKLNDDGSYIIRKESPFVRYKIEVLQFVIKDIDFDETIDNLISKKKEAEQQRVLSKSRAEQAKQLAIQAEMEGKAKVAEAEATANVIKIKATVQAQQEKEVGVLKAEKERDIAKLNKERADLEAAADLAKGRAEAEKNKLLVDSGLTPQEKAEYAKDTAIGVAAELAKTQFPVMMNFGIETGVNNPLEAIGYDAMFDLTQKMSGNK